MLHDDISVSAPDAATEQLYDELKGGFGLGATLFVLHAWWRTPLAPSQLTRADAPVIGASTPTPGTAITTA